MQGFIRVYSKDIHQLRLSNVLLSKTGASGIRTALLTLSADAQSKKSIALKKGVANNNDDTKQECTPSILPSTNSCPCGKKFAAKGWLARHQSSCTKYLALDAPQNQSGSLDKESAELDN